MSIVDIRKALGHTAAGVSWRLLVFLGAALCFNALLSLGNWSGSYAPSEAWGGAVEREGLDWSPIVSAAAKAMAKQRPAQTFGTEASFYNALLDHIKREGDKLTLEKPYEERLEEYQDYRERVQGRKETKAEYKRETLPRDKEFVKQSLLLTQANAEVAAADMELEHLKSEISVDKEKLAEAEAKLKKSKARREAIFAYIKELSTERATLEAGIKKPLAEQEAGIKSAEDGIHAAFVAALPSARPVNGFITRHLPANWLLQVGNETRPLHIIYVVLWYGLEAAIVFLLCLVWVPWLVRLGGGTSDPAAVQSKFTERVKNWLASAFGARVATGATRALIAATVGAVALAGVTMAAGDPPSITPLLPNGSIVGAKGDKGEAGQPAAPAKPGDPGKDGLSGSDGKDVIPPDLLRQLTDQQDRLTKQADLIARLQGRLQDVTDQVGQTSEQVRSLVKTTDSVVANFGLLSTGMGTIINDVSTLSTSVDGLTTADRSILRASSAAHLHLVGRLNYLGTTAATAATDIGQVKTQVNQVSLGLPPTAADLLRINAMPGGTLPRVNPFYRYKVTDDVLGTMKRAMQGLDEAKTSKIIAVLTEVKDKPMRIWKFGKELHKACGKPTCDEDDQELLEQLMPLIRKLSRV